MQQEAVQVPHILLEVQIHLERVLEFHQKKNYRVQVRGCQTENYLARVQGCQTENYQAQAQGFQIDLLHLLEWELEYCQTTQVLVLQELEPECHHRKRNRQWLVREFQAPE